VFGASNYQFDFAGASFILLFVPMPKPPTRQRKLIARPVKDEPPLPPPQRQEWLLLIINIVFVATGVFLIPSSPDVGIVTLAFFGTCLLTTFAFQWRRHMDRIFRARTVEVVAGVKIKPQRRIILLMGGWLTGLGAIMYKYSGSYPIIFEWLCLLLVVIGFGLLISALMGVLPKGYLQFDPEGFTIGDFGWAMQIPWDNISDVQQGEYNMNPVVNIDFADIDAVLISPAGKRQKALRKLVFNSNILGTPIMLMPMHYGIPRPVLAGAIIRYCNSAEARAGMRKAIK
jgi:hypothetical protein